MKNTMVMYDHILPHYTIVNCWLPVLQQILRYLKVGVDQAFIIKH